MSGSAERAAGFTLLEVLVTLALLGIGTAMTLSLVSGSLGKIRKVQVRARAVQHAQTVMELSLLDGSIKGPTALRGDFEDGSRWTMMVDDFDMAADQPLQTGQVEIPLKVLAYTVEITGPESRTPDYRLQTLRLVSTTGARGLPRPGGRP